ncbi:MAG: helix-turn-helix domain-containing protein [Deltaproteobacteria bacterium]
MNPKFVDLLERLVIAMEQIKMPTGQEWQAEKIRVQEGVPKGLLTVDEAAQRLGISKHSLRGWVSQRRIPHVKIGRRTLFNPTDLDNLIKAFTVEPRKPPGRY